MKKAFGCQVLKPSSEKRIITKGSGCFTLSPLLALIKLRVPVTVV